MYVKKFPSRGKGSAEWRRWRRFHSVFGSLDAQGAGNERKPASWPSGVKEKVTALTSSTQLIHVHPQPSNNEIPNVILLLLLLHYGTVEFRVPSGHFPAARNSWGGGWTWEKRCGGKRQWSYGFFLGLEQSKRGHSIGVDANYRCSLLTRFIHPSIVFVPPQIPTVTVVRERESGTREMLVRVGAGSSLSSPAIVLTAENATARSPTWNETSPPPSSWHEKPAFYNGICPRTPALSSNGEIEIQYFLLLSTN